MLRQLSATFALAACLALPAAATVKVAVPTLSGHFNENMEGRSAAALRAIYELCDERVEFVQFRWGQHWLAFEDNKDFDAVALVWDDAGVTGYPSDDFIHSRNGVAFRADAGFDIKTLQDLKGLRVLGFGGATSMFPKLGEVLPTLASYWEAPPGFATTQALVAGDADAFVTDGLIFAIDYMERVQKTGGTYGDDHWPRMRSTALFDENGDKMHFRSKKKRDLFNACLARAQEIGAIAKATELFVTPYRDIVGDQVPDH
jgi:ABC-type amino acid transport substrate-binding protein